MTNGQALALIVVLVFVLAYVVTIISAWARMGRGDDDDDE